MKINNVEVTDYELYVLSRWAYSVGVSFIDDAYYNQLHKSMLKNMPDSPYASRSWSSDPCPVDLLKKVDRTDLIAKVVIGDKTESIPSINDWSEFNASLRSICGPGTLSMKMDGWNIQYNYYNGELVSVQTRGRSSDFMDVPKLACKAPAKIPVQGIVRVVTEATISDSNFPKCRKMFGNVSQRAAVSTVIAKSDDMSLIDVHAHGLNGMPYDPDKKFDILSSWGFAVPPYLKVSSFGDLQVAFKELSRQKESFCHPTDGVVYWGSKIVAIRLGAWEEPLYQSYVLGYEEEYSEHRINPKVKIFPIMRTGGSQNLVTITNWQRIINNRLKPGSPIAFRLASDSVADIDEEFTHRLQLDWDGHEDVFACQIRTNEEAKKAQANFEEMRV